MSGGGRTGVTFNTSRFAARQWFFVGCWVAAGAVTGAAFVFMTGSFAPIARKARRRGMPQVTEKLLAGVAEQRRIARSGELPTQDAA